MKTTTAAPTEEKRLGAKLDTRRMPQQLVVIRDGNGRRAKRHHLSRVRESRGVAAVH